MNTETDEWEVTGNWSDEDIKEEYIPKSKPIEYDIHIIKNTLLEELFQSNKFIGLKKAEHLLYEYCNNINRKDMSTIIISLTQKIEFVIRIYEKDKNVYRDLLVFVFKTFVAQIINKKNNHEECVFCNTLDCRYNNYFTNSVLMEYYKYNPALTHECIMRNINKHKIEIEELKYYVNTLSLIKVLYTKENTKSFNSYCKNKTNMLKNAYLIDNMALITCIEEYCPPIIIKDIIKKCKGVSLEYLTKKNDENIKRERKRKQIIQERKNKMMKQDKQREIERNDRFGIKYEIKNGKIYYRPREPLIKHQEVCVTISDSINDKTNLYCDENKLNKVYDTGYKNIDKCRKRCINDMRNSNYNSYQRWFDYYIDCFMELKYDGVIEKLLDLNIDKANFRQSLLLNINIIIEILLKITKNEQTLARIYFIKEKLYKTKYIIQVPLKKALKNMQVLKQHFTSLLNIVFKYSNDISCNINHKKDTVISCNNLMRNFKNEIDYIQGKKQLNRRKLKLLGELNMLLG